jgi:hypothetical protein
MVVSQEVDRQIYSTIPSHLGQSVLESAVTQGGLSHGLMEDVTRLRGDRTSPDMSPSASGSGVTFRRVSKAYDRFPTTLLWEVLRRMGGRFIFSAPSDQCMMGHNFPWL